MAEKRKPELLQFGFMKTKRKENWQNDKMMEDKCKKKLSSKLHTETSATPVQFKKLRIGPEALHISQVRQSDVFRIDCLWPLSQVLQKCYSIDWY